MSERIWYVDDLIQKLGFHQAMQRAEQEGIFTENDPRRGTPDSPYYSGYQTNEPPVIPLVPMTGDPTQSQSLTKSDNTRYFVYAGALIAFFLFFWFMRNKVYG